MGSRKFVSNFKCGCYMKDPCTCPQRLNANEIFQENVLDVAQTVSEAMGICGIHSCKRMPAMNVVVNAFLHYNEIRTRIDAVPRKRLCKENLLHELGRKCLMNRMEAQLSYSIIKRAFTAFYFATSSGGVRNPAFQQQLVHSTECAWVHAAKRTAQIYAIYEGMFLQSQQYFEAQLRCIYKHLYDRLQKRYELEAMPTECTCAGCLRRNIESRLTTNETTASASVVASQDVETGMHLKLLKVKRPAPENEEEGTITEQKAEIKIEQKTELKGGLKREQKSEHKNDPKKVSVVLNHRTHGVEMVEKEVQHIVMVDISDVHHDKMKEASLESTTSKSKVHHVVKMQGSLPKNMVKLSVPEAPQIYKSNSQQTTTEDTDIHSSLDATLQEESVAVSTETTSVSIDYAQESELLEDELLEEALTMHDMSEGSTTTAICKPCQCMPLTCDDDIDSKNCITAECSQGPYKCTWYPLNPRAHEDPFNERPIVQQESTEESSISICDPECICDCEGTCQCSLNSGEQATFPSSDGVETKDDTESEQKSGPKTEMKTDEKQIRPTDNLFSPMQSLMASGWYSHSKRTPLKMKHHHQETHKNYLVEEAQVYDKSLPSIDDQHRLASVKSDFFPIHTNLTARMAGSIIQNERTSEEKRKETEEILKIIGEFL